MKNLEEKSHHKIKTFFHILLSLMTYGPALSLHSHKFDSYDGCVSIEVSDLEKNGCSSHHNFTQSGLLTKTSLLAVLNSLQSISTNTNVYIIK